MDTHNKFAVVLLLILSIGNFTYAQSVIILAPGHLIKQPIASKDTALITWTVRPRQQREYIIEIKSFFDDSIATFVTRDTFLIISPNLAPEEDNLLIKVNIPNDHGYRNQVALRRKEFSHVDNDILNAETCNAGILELLHREMYLSASFVYHRYRSIFQIEEFADIFRKIETSDGEGTLEIRFNNGKPFVREQYLSGAVHRN